jgi:hypothetical protein
MGGDGGDNIQVILDKLAQLAGQPPPPGITPDQLAAGRAYISQLLKVLGIASNSGDPADVAAAQAGYDERGLKTGDALTKFPANEAESSAKMAGVGNQNEMAQMVQQIPQMASGLAGSLSGALGGLLQPLGQIAQIGQQAMQAGMGGLQHGAAAAGEAIPGELLGATSGVGELGGGGAGGGDLGAGGLGATTPTAMLGPLPAPSAGTEPASAHASSPPPANTSTPPAAPRGAMGAMPMMPPGAMHGAAGAGSDAKPDTKRVVSPAVKNGAPVQGRITTPPPTPEVTKRTEGKPIASRRILLPDHKRDDDADSTR